MSAVLRWNATLGTVVAKADRLASVGRHNDRRDDPPRANLAARGHRGHEGCFDPKSDGPSWLVFREPDNPIFWQPRTGEIAWWNDRPFALGEHLVDETTTYAMGLPLTIYSDPLAWLINGRDGIVVLDWSRAFDRLREVPRVSICENLLTTYRRAMRPRHLPDVSSFREGERRAAE